MWSQDLFELEDEFEQAAQATSVAKQKAVQAQAVKVRTRLHARRASSEAILAHILPAVIEDGDSWHVISGGDVDSLSYLAHILKSTSLDYCAFSTWCMALPDVEQFEKWMQSKQIKHLDAYVGEIFPNQYGDEYEKLCQLIEPTKGRVCVFKNHSKVMLCKKGKQHWVIQSSANINTNPRAENTIITASKELFDHHKAFFDGIKSFDKSFRPYKPAP